MISPITEFFSTTLVDYKFSCVHVNTAWKKKTQIVYGP